MLQMCKDCTKAQSAAQTFASLIHRVFSVSVANFHIIKGCINLCFGFDKLLQGLLLKDVVSG